MSDYPEHDKLTKISDKTQAIGAFLEWCAYEKGVQLGRHDGHDFRPEGGSQALMAEWAGIDMNVIEAEKRQMLAEMRALNDGE